MARINWLKGSAVTAGALAAAVLSGCGVKPVNPDLERARAAYSEAQADAAVNRNAPAALREAQQALQRAEKAAEQNAGAKQIEHLSYLTTQRVDIARARAEQRANKNAIDELAKERERTLLEIRAREAEAAERRAALAQTEADRARTQAELAQAQARQAERSAEQRRIQLQLSQEEAAAAAARAERLEQELSSVQAKVRETDRGLVLTLGNLLFDFDKAELKAGVKRNLEPLVDFLEESPGRSVLVEGHTDSVGSDSYNQGLSERRADAVRLFLIERGIASERILSKGYGEAYPVADNSTDAGRQANRRVEVIILREGESPDSQLR